MSTIASPRPSLSLSVRSNSNTSRRTSTDTIRSITGARSPTTTTTHTRRNRAALREFYGLKGQQPGAAEGSDGSGIVAEDKSSSGEEKTAFGELDVAGFEAEGWVRNVLGREGLEGVMRVEAGILSEMRGLDGERKALVYDNYSKLIAATETIKKMRSSMDPLIPTTSTLAPAISHIAETAATLSESLRKLAPQPLSDDLLAERKKEEQREAVRWVLDAPARLRSLRDQGQIESARKDWEQVKMRLDRWKSVKGADEVRKECEEVMGAEAGS